MKHRKIPCWALWLAAFPLSLGAAGLTHAVDPFHRTDKDENYEIHVIRPALPGDPVAPAGEAEAWLGRFAAAVEKDETSKGHINANTKPFEDREMAFIREGRWPLVLVTLQGETEILVGFAIEIRTSGSELLSFQHRFKYFADVGAPLTTQTSLCFAFIDPRSWFDFPEMRDPYNLRQLNAMLLVRPWICGEVGEVKKFYVNVRDPLFLVQAVHQTMVESEVLKVSRVVPTETDWLRYRFAVAELLATQEVDRILSQLELDLGRMVGPQPSLTAQMNSYFKNNLFNPEWQPFVRISKLYTQISGPAAARETSAKARLLEALFGLPPEPRWNILETDETGTAGIRTRIYEFTVPYYEVSAAHALMDRTGIEVEREVVYHPTACPKALSTLENHLRSHVKRDSRD